ncbi:hypothetical protein SHDE107825_06755 [Shewanella denitrificans]|jgi:hypothetical protein
MRHGNLPADRQPHGRSLASDLHGSGKCHYDDGIIIDHAIAAFMSPFTSDEAVRLKFKSSAMDDFGLHNVGLNRCGLH